jgi:hypothetical protein
MPKALAPGQPYAGRAPGVVPVNVSLDKDAYALLRMYAPTSKGYGRFLSRLIYEYAERQRIVGKITGALAEEETTGAE